jgi:Ca-activated chloride channel family protein
MVMRLACSAGLAMVALATAGGAPMSGRGGQAAAIRIVSPQEDAILTGVTVLEAEILASETSSDFAVRTVSFFVDGRLVCTVEAPPFRCTWDAGAVVSGHHVRVVASLANGERLIGNVHTKQVGHTERIKVEAVLVPVIVTDRGKFVRGLKKQDFEVLEDGVAQSVGSLVSEDTPLELVLAIDISGSMEQALPDVKVAVKHLLSKLRPGDAATLIGFNDTTFLVAESETDPRARQEAVDLLTSWGGTALYDATIFSIDFVNRRWGRKGVVIFSDGDDRHSLTRRDAAMARVQSSDAMLFTIGFGGAASLPELRKRLQEYAVSTGGRAFFPRDPKQLDEVFGTIVSELSNQYVLSYSPANPTPESKWRTITVRVPKGRYDIRARQGYRSLGSRAER